MPKALKKLQKSSEAGTRKGRKGGDRKVDTCLVQSLATFVLTLHGTLSLTYFDSIQTKQGCKPSAHKFRSHIVWQTHLTPTGNEGNEHHTQMAGITRVKTVSQQFLKLLCLVLIISAWT